MKQFFFFIGIFFIALLECNAQNTKLQDVLYLKNGSVIKGNVIEQIMDSIVKIEIIDGSLFVFKMNEVEKIIKEKVQIHYGDAEFGTSEEFGKIKQKPFTTLLIGSHVMVGASLYSAYISGSINGIYVREDIRSFFSTLPVFGCGFSLEYRFNKTIAFEADLSYYSKAAKISFPGMGSISLRTHYATLPLHCLVYFGPKPTSFLLDFGIFGGVLATAYTNIVGYTNTPIKENSTSSFNRFLFGINGGFGFYGFRLNVIWEPANLWSQTMIDAVCYQSGIENGDFNTKTVNFMLSYTYKFNPKEKLPKNKYI